MLKNYFLLVFVFLFLSNIYSQTTAIPDPNFEQALIDLGIDTDGIININQSVATADISMFPGLVLASKNISDLTGIEDFTSLDYLDCSDNQIESLDLSQNTLLETLLCHSNQLTGLDVSQNTALTHLSMSSNPLISTLNVSLNPELIYLECIDTGLSALDVSNNLALTYLACDFNQITSLDVSNNLALTYLACGGNQITSLDVTQNLLLNTFGCDYNQITSLDVTQNLLLSNFSCSVNQLSSLDVSQNTDLAWLWCDDNQLTTLDLSLNTNLTDVKCNTNLLESLNIKNGNNSSITTFNATNNTSLTCIDVDNEIDANAGTGFYSTWSKDATATYSEDCQSFLSIDDELLAQAITFYPNPVTNILTIDSEIPLTKVEIYSVLGRKVKEINSDFESILTSNLSNGVYLVRIFSENGLTAKKLIKK